MGDIELQIFSDRLKELRTSLHLTQTQFVEGLGITPAALSAYEKNSKNPSIGVAKRIAEKYNVSIDWLCGLSDKKSNTRKISTYTDAINAILELYNANNLNFDIIYHEGFEGVVMACDNKEINDFFIEWVKIRRLYNENVINDEMYHPWLSTKLNTMDKEIANVNNKNKVSFIEILNDYLKDF